MQIKKVNCGLLGNASEVIVTIMPFATDATEVQTHYSVKNENGEVIKDGNYWLTAQEFSLWGSDNSFVENCVLNHLGLERA